MNKSHSGFLKGITGVVLISKDGNDMLCCIEDMQNSKHFTIGQIFNAVRVLYGKSVSDYGTLWPRYKDANDNISNDWKALTQAQNNCESDYEFLVAACEQLKEEVPEVVPREKVLQQLNLFKEILSDLPKQ